MIAFLKGMLAYKYDASVIIDVQGVGYTVYASALTISRLPAVGSEVQIFTYHQITENTQSLHGFTSQEEVRLFTLLISVSGIGPKVASAVLATLSPQQLMMAIVAEDVNALSAAPGVGKKTAQRVLLELRDKIKTDDTFIDTSPIKAGPTVGSGKQDAMDALIALGYARSEAMQAILEIADEDMAADQIIRLSLKKLMR